MFLQSNALVMYIDSPVQSFFDNLRLYFPTSSQNWDLMRISYQVWCKYK